MKRFLLVRIVQEIDKFRYISTLVEMVLQKCLYNDYNT